MIGDPPFPRTAGSAARSRRAFLRSVSGLGLVGVGLSGCVPDVPGRDGPPRDGFGGGGLRPLTRPILRAWADDLVWIDTPFPELPVAYVSMALRRVFVDHEYRDRASWLLRAHISVSTALWRIPLPGDPAGQPITPGDMDREFEELSMRAWDPSLPPAIDDIRIVRGRPVGRRIDFRCISLAGGIPPAVQAAASARAWGLASEAEAQGEGAAEAWLSGGPLDVMVSDGSDDDVTREDFRTVGSGLRFRERGCATDGDAVQYVAWAVRD
jgi:hypothetical protein